MCEACEGGTPPGGLERRFFGVLATEGFITGDGRGLTVGAIRLDALPLPLPFSAQLFGSSPGHDNSWVVGTIDKMERRPSIIEGAPAGAMDVWAEGHFSDNMEGYFAAALVETAMKDGRRGYDVSIDPDRVAYEVRMSKRYAEETVEEITKFVKSMEDGSLFELPSSPADLGEVNPDGSVTVAKAKPDDVVFMMTDVELRSATLVRIGAMSHGWVRLGPPPMFVEVPASAESAGAEEMAASAEQAAVEAETEPAMVDAEDLGELVTLAASGGPLAPPTTWFDDPRFTGPTPLTITPEGRVYGHLALWDTCHTSYPSRCVKPPKNPDYSQFHNASVLTAEGEIRAVGSLVLGGEHAPLSFSASEVMRMHADASARVASMRAGQDRYGTWCAGAILPDVTPEQVARLRSSAWSGHWNNGRLTIALAVNSPGFPVPVQDRVVARALAASFGEEPLSFISEPWSETLVAAGCGCSCSGECGGGSEEMSEEAETAEEAVEEAVAEVEEAAEALAEEAEPETDPALLEELEAARALMDSVA